MFRYTQDLYEKINLSKLFIKRNKIYVGCVFIFFLSLFLIESEVIKLATIPVCIIMIAYHLWTDKKYSATHDKLLDQQEKSETSTRILNQLTVIMTNVINNISVIKKDLDRIRKLYSRAVYSLNFAQLNSNYQEQGKSMEGLVNKISQQTTFKSNTQVEITSKNSNKIFLADEPKNDLSIQEFIMETDNILDDFVAYLLTVKEGGGQTVEKVDDVFKKIKSIHSLLSDMQAISEQTSLLALNAAFESARAGKDGRSFSIVADELRKLSRRSNEFNLRVKQQLDKTLHIVREAKDIASHSSNHDFNIIFHGKEAIAKMSESLSSLETYIKETMREIVNYNEKININTSESTNNLQFEDIVNKVTTHINKETELIHELLNDAIRISSSSNLKSSDLKSIKEIYKSLEKLELDYQSKYSKLSSPIVQENISTGETKTFH